MILRLTCPKCTRDSYSASAEKFKPCPYCGILFSGKYGTDKRGSVRLDKEIPLQIAYQGQHIIACTMNISESGMCIKIIGSAPLNHGETLDLSVNNAQVKARVMWSDSESERHSSVHGLQIVDGTVISA